MTLEADSVVRAARIAGGSGDLGAIRVGACRDRQQLRLVVAVAGPVETSDPLGRRLRRVVRPAGRERELDQPDVQLPGELRFRSGSTRARPSSSKRSASAGRPHAGCGAGP